MRLTKMLLLATCLMLGTSQAQQDDEDREHGTGHAGALS